MATVQDLITNSLKEIGAIAIGETPTAAESADALSMLNNMLDLWNTESLMVYNINSTVFNYVAGQATYTIGTGGNFNIVRPVKIEAAYNRQYNGAQNQYDFKIHVTEDFQEYSDIQAKNITSVLPIVMYDDGNYPLKNLTFYPIPQNSTYQLVLWYWTVVDSVSALTDTVTLPPGYKIALEFNLALLLANRYGKPVTPLLVDNAVKTKAQIARINTEPGKLTMPDRLLSGRVNYTWQDFYAGK